MLYVDDDGGRDGGSLLEWTAPFTGDYYVEVRSFDRSFDTGSYSLSLEITSLPGTLSGFYVGPETSDVDGSSAEFRLDVQERDGTVTGFVEVSLPHIGDSDVLNGTFSGNVLTFDTAFSYSGDRYECSYAAQRQPDQQTLIGIYDCIVVGSTFNDTGTYTLSLMVRDEHSDSIQSATFISAGITSGAIDPADDSDFFGFSAEAGATYTIEVFLETHPDTMLVLYDSQGNFLEENDDGDGMDGGSRLEWTAPVSGDYYLEVFSYYWESDTGSYTLSLSEYIAPDEHGDSIQSATSISAGLTYGAINPPSDLDFFRFSAQAGSTYTIEVFLDTHPNTILILFDSRGNFIAENDDGLGLDGGSRLEWNAPASGDYYLKVYSFDQSFDTGSYTLSLSEYIAPDEHGDSIQSATSISAGLTSGAIDPPLDLDFFRFSAQAGAAYTIEVFLDTHPGTVLILFDSRGNVLDQNVYGLGGDGGSRIEWTAPAAGDYYVEVRSFDQTFARGSYTLSLDRTGPTPSVLIDGQEPRSFALNFLTKAIEAEMESYRLVDVSYAAQYYAGSLLRNVQAYVDNLSDQGQHLIAGFDWAWWGFPDVRVISDTKIEVDDCEKWSHDYYRADTGVLVSSEPESTLPQTLTLERLATGWFVTGVVFYDPPHFCSG